MQELGFGVNLQLNTNGVIKTCSNSEIHPETVPGSPHKVAQAATERAQNRVENSSGNPQSKDVEAVDTNLNPPQGSSKSEPLKKKNFPQF